MSDEFDALLAVSARLGRDPLLVQGPGGNTSIKAEGVMWIKASGTWLARAEDEAIMVPVDLAPLLDAVERDDPAAETARAFVPAARNPAGLRPSIETTVHALMPHAAVLHVHCVETIAWAVRADAAAALAAPLSGLDWAFIPYVRPGLPLARAIAARRGRADVLVLGNHGLVVAGETVAEAEALLGRVRDRLRLAPRPAPAADLAALARAAEGSGWRPADDPRAHAAAMDPESLAVAVGGTLYPDHLIFLGPGARARRGGETVAEAAAGAPFLLLPGQGALLREGASESAEALAACLAEVAARVAPGAAAYLTASDEDRLVNWDAEKYRRALDADGPAR